MKSFSCKSITVWSLFCFAITQFAGLFINGSVILYNAIPSVLFFLYIFYHFFKTEQIIGFWGFLKSLTFISTPFYIAEYLYIRFIQLLYINRPWFFICSSIVGSILTAMILYLITFRIIKKRLV